MDSFAPEYGTVQDAANRFQVSTRTVRNWIAAGTIDAVRVGPKLIRVDLNTLRTTAVGGGRA
ncbi:hypothetical protein BH10ACT6_BH10ACT6_01260 [soil metagenome]